MRPSRSIHKSTFRYFLKISERSLMSSPSSQQHFRGEISMSATMMNMKMTCIATKPFRSSCQKASVKASSKPSSNTQKIMTHITINYQIKRPTHPGRSFIPSFPYRSTTICKSERFRSGCEVSPRACRTASLSVLRRERLQGIGCAGTRNCRKLYLSTQSMTDRIINRDAGFAPQGSFLGLTNFLSRQPVGKRTCEDVYNLSMSRILIKITVLLLVLSLAQTAQLYKKVIHNTDANAKCLDGSSPAVYFHQGTEKNKFLIYFVGGGYCMGSSLSQVLESCYKRSKTDFGSSKNLPETYEGQGYLSTDPATNKFASWTKVVINYCDGAFHSSGTKQAYRYKDAELYFRGSDITRSHLKWLTTNYDLPSAEKVLLTGSSIGGTAAWLWSTYVSGLLANPMGLSVVSDSSVFMNLPTVSGEMKLETQAQNLYRVSNVDEKTPLSTCNRFKVGEEYRCLSLEYAWTSLNVRLLLVNSQYDSWFIYNGTEITCVTEGTAGKTLKECSSSDLANIENNRKSLLNFFSLFGQLSRNSIWAISCSGHMYTDFDKLYDSSSLKVPGQTGETIRTAVERFVLNGERVSSVDGVSWPNNAACAY